MKHNLRFLSLLLALVLCMSSLTLTAFASGDDPEQDSSYTEETSAPEETEPTEPPPESIPEETLPLIAENGTGFTEDGNIVTRDLLYDKNTNKQFITIETRNGNTFYIIIDYDKPTDEDSEQYHTYFLNLVDEADLEALLEEESTPITCGCSEKCVAGAVNVQCEVCAINMTECVGEEPEQPTEPTEPTEEPVEEPEPAAQNNQLMLIVVLIAALIGSGIFFVVKSRKNPKGKTRGNSNLDDYDFGDDDEGEYAEFEQYDPDAEQEDT